MGEALFGQRLRRLRKEHGETQPELARLLGPYRDRQIDAIVLGCTHFPFLREPIARLFPDAQIFDGLEGTAQRLKYLLDERGLRSTGTAGSVEYQSSGGEKSIRLMKALMAELE